MVLDKQPGQIRMHWDSLQELQRWIEETPKTWSSNESASNKASERWDLSTGYQGALKLAREGWQAGANMMTDALIHLPAIDTVPDWQHDVAGFFPDVGRYCSGMPDNMINYHDDAHSGAKPIITLAVPISTSCSTKAQCMANFGLAIARYVDELEASGRRVEVIAAMVADCAGGYRVCHSWNVKHADQAMDLASVAFSIAHPAMLRRLLFATLERTPCPTTSGYGRPKDLKLSDLTTPSTGTIILNGMRHANACADTPERALDTVKAQIDAAFEDHEAASVGA